MSCYRAHGEPEPLTQYALPQRPVRNPGGQPRPGLNRATVAERVITIRSWEELKDDPNVWRGR
jgi:hypothetical protein